MGSWGGLSGVWGCNGGSKRRTEGGIFRATAGLVGAVIKLIFLNFG